MCIIHDQKFACGCWRKPSGQSELTFCSIAHRNIGPGTNKPVQCHIDDCQAAIRPSIWYCLEHAPCKKFSGNYEALKANLSKEALAHVLDHGSELPHIMIGNLLTKRRVRLRAQTILRGRRERREGGAHQEGQREHGRESTGGRCGGEEG